MALGVAALSLGVSAPANAADISGAITNVTVGPSSPKEGSQVTTSIDWKVPDGTQSGDTFTLTLSAALKNLPLGFHLTDPATGADVADATLSSTDPSVITFVMTAYASTHFETHGTAFVTSNFSSALAPAGVPTPFTSTTPDGQSFTSVITPTGGSPANTAAPIKYGSFASSDQGRVNPKDFLIFHVGTPVGPFDSATISDTVPAGQKWTYDCSTAQLFDVTVSATGTQLSSHLLTGGSTTCSPTTVTATLPAQVAGHASLLRIAASLPAGTGATAPAQTFLNTAQVGWVTAGAPHSQAVSSSTTQASAGGTGAGTNPVAAVAILKGDSNGNAADTDATAATLPVNGKASLVYTITNTGTDTLTAVNVSDQVLANGAVAGLTCDFSKLGGPATGTTFSGHFAPGATFGCTASLSGVTSTGADHHDVGTVTATGVTSGTAVTASNDYFAKVTPGAAGTPPTGGNTGTPPTGGGTGTGPGTPTGGTTGPGTTTTTPVTSPVAPAATGTTPLADSGAGSLAYTGSNVEGPLGLAGGLLALGALLSVLGVLRRRRAAEQG